MRAFAQSIVETVRHPLLVLDRGLRIQACNHAFCQVFRVRDDELQNSFLCEIDNGVWNTPALGSLLHEVIALGQAFEDFKVEQEFPRIGPRALLLSARQVYREEDQLPMVFLAIEDITEKNRAQQDLGLLNSELELRVLERTAQLEAANKEMEAFCYSVSHDLRAPLRAIDGFSQELLQNYGDKMDDQGRHYLQRVRVGSQRMAQLIDDLLQLSRLSRGEMQCRQVDLSALVQGVAAELKRRDPGRHIDFVIQPGLRAPCDPGLLQVVLENLLDNAWKFTSKHAEATIQFGQIETEGVRPFYVRDDGAGFDMRFAGKLFGAFQRLHPERMFPGTGVGLATVQRVIHRHGGKVWAEGNVEKGATFYFTLPERSE